MAIPERSSRRVLIRGREDGGTAFSVGEIEFVGLAADLYSISCLYFGNVAQVLSSSFFCGNVFSRRKNG
jgi:hypothetical protein